jgi:hypothetical protein
MCVEWRDSFEAFYRDMGPRPTPEHSVDRRDGTQGYYPHNCRWATVIEQNNNTKKNIRFEYRGEMKTLAEWCRELKLKYQTVYYRITELKWTFAEAVTPIESMPITFDGETKSLEAWCDMLGLRPNETYIRILRGVAFDVIVAE